jgi:serine protease AprX
MRIEREWLEELIFGGEAPRRFTQDSPLLPDVWLAYGEQGSESEATDLLVTPYRDLHPGRLVRQILDEIAPLAGSGEGHYDIANNQAVVAVRLSFREVVDVALALSPWWKLEASSRGRPLAPAAVKKPAAARSLAREIDDLSWHQLTRQRLLQPPSSRGRPTRPLQATPRFTPGFLWFIRVTGTMALALKRESLDEPDKARLEAFRTIAWSFDAQVSAFLRLLPREIKPKPALFLISLNRPAFLAMDRSVPTIKADAAIRLFDIRCNRICWAIVDSGVDATHPAFRRREARGHLVAIPRGDHASTHSRVARTFDFTRVRALLNPMASEAAYVDRLRQVLAVEAPGVRPRRRPDASFEAAGAAKRLRTLLIDGRMLDWELLIPFLEVAHGPHYVCPVHYHGTHVAGILAADWRRRDFPEDDPLHPGDEDLVGVCPDIELHDFRIFSGDAASDEFAIMGVLQFIRWLNERGDQPVIHGVNLSLSIQHDVTNFACGRTPVCAESARLVNSGVVVVAAAGNEGRAEYTLTSGGRSEGYRSISISDPGNTEEVITVGATHRHQPHAYGVSYFSSRGPTGDGRVKPDLVAPGEKITAPVPGGLSTKDGTSMAAPHVSGAAALLLARHRELLGNPLRVKEILCRTATDLGRERYFQGAGLVDVLRAIQSV